MDINEIIRKIINDSEIIKQKASIEEQNKVLYWDMMFYFIRLLQIKAMASILWTLTFAFASTSRTRRLFSLGFAMQPKILTQKGFRMTVVWGKAQLNEPANEVMSRLPTQL